MNREATADGREQPGEPRWASPAAAGAAGAAGKAAGSVAKAAACALSFSADMLAATPDGGAQAIGTLQVGDSVEAYDPATGQTSPQTVEHVWLNHDDDLIDLTLRADHDAMVRGATSDSKQHEAELAAHGLRAPPTRVARQPQAASQADADDGAACCWRAGRGRVRHRYLGIFHV